MKYLLMLALFCTTPQFAQELLMDTEDVQSADVVEPKFNGGNFQTFIDYVNAQFDYSKVTAPGKLVFSFTITEKGEMSNIRIVQFADVGSATEIIRVLQNAPKWESAKRAGKPFSVNVKYPMVFKMVKN